MANQLDPALKKSEALSFLCRMQHAWLLQRFRFSPASTSTNWWPLQMPWRSGGTWNLAFDSLERDDWTEKTDDFTLFERQRSQQLWPSIHSSFIRPWGCTLGRGRHSSHQAGHFCADRSADHPLRLRAGQGDSGDCFFIVMEGECVAMKAGKWSKKLD